MEEAGQMFSQVVSLVPDSFIGYSNLGIVRVSQGRYEESVPLLQRSLSIHETGDAKSNLATAYFQSKRYAEAATLFERAAAIDPQNYELWGNLGDAYYWAPGLRASASEAYRKAVELAEARRQINPRDANLLSYLASYYAMLGKRIPAQERISEAVRLAPNDAEVLFYSAVVHSQFGETAKVLDALERSVAAGYSRETIRDTPNFTGLQGDSRFQRLISKSNPQKGKNS
jgi:Flp pilus assembly protein TadD